MGVAEMIGLAASISFLSGWRVYLCVLAVGLAMHFGWLALPQNLTGFAVLASPWVIAAASIGLVAEFLADKIAWIDSAWDAVHTAIRPVAGAVLALAVTDPNDPAWQVVVLLLGGSAALIGHGAKARARAVTNLSPEPVTNVALSTSEDLVSGGLLALAIANPIGAIIVALLVGAGSILILVKLRRLMARLVGR